MPPVTHETTHLFRTGARILEPHLSQPFEQLFRADRLSSVFFLRDILVHTWAPGRGVTPLRDPCAISFYPSAVNRERTGSPQNMRIKTASPPPWGRRSIESQPKRSCVLFPPRGCASEHQSKHGVEQTAQDRDGKWSRVRTRSRRLRGALSGLFAEWSSTRGFCCALALPPRPFWPPLRPLRSLYLTRLRRF